DLAREHSFQPNEPARRLTTKRSHVAALVTYAYKKADTITDAFMLEMMSGITAGLHANGYDLLVIQIEPDDTEWVARYLGSGRVDGFVITAARCTQQHLFALRSARAPFVVWGAPPGRNDFSTVSGDNAEGGRLATACLLDRGCTRIGFIGGSRNTVEGQDRYPGDDDALAAADVAVDPELVVYGDYSAGSGAEAMRTLLNVGVDGVFVTSDVMALAAMDEIRARGLRIPDDIAIVGYDDIALAEHSDPRL